MAFRREDNGEDVLSGDIYYGCRIPQDKYSELHEIALEKGLAEHFMVVENAADEYRMRVRD